MTKEELQNLKHNEKIKCNDVDAFNKKYEFASLNKNDIFTVINQYNFGDGEKGVYAINYSEQEGYGDCLFLEEDSNLLDVVEEEHNNGICKRQSENA